MIRVLFVCTGNVFRSMAAEKCLKDFLMRNGITDIEADSAGIAPIPQRPRKETLDRLAHHGIEAGHHRYKKVNQALIDGSDLVIAMNLDHQKRLKEAFGVDAPLFNEVAFGKREGVLDFGEHDPTIRALDDPENEEKVREYAYHVVDYLHDAMPALLKDIRGRARG